MYVKESSNICNHAEFVARCMDTLLLYIYIYLYDAICIYIYIRYVWFRS